MKWLVVLDPIDGLISRTDTSLAFIDKAREMNIEVDTATIYNLYFEEYAAVESTDKSGKKKVERLGDYELIFMRKEPPYDLSFHYATHLLSLADTLVVNSPSSLRDFNEKLIALPFKQHMPATLVSSDREIIRRFFEKHGKCVVKSLDSFQGKSVAKYESFEPEVIESITEGGKKPVMVQEFLDLVYEGDKRVIMLGDTFMGAAMRRPKKGYHANFANSDALKTTLTANEKQIIEELGPWFVEHGIHFVGLDLIGEKLTEINITCPTGIVQISELDGRDLAEEMVLYFTELCKR